MICNTPEQMDAAIEQHKAINDIKKNQTAEVSVQFLDTTQAVVSKVDGSYKAIGRLAAIKQSVTERIGKKFKYFRENPLLEQQGDIGNQVHELTQFVTDEILKTTSLMSNEEAYQYTKATRPIAFPKEGLKKISATYGKTLDAKSEENLIKAVQENLFVIYRQQQAINKITGKDGIVRIRTEQIVIDPRRDIGGTIDFLAVFSDNTAAIIDYKTKILRKDNKDAFGNILDGSKVVTKKDLEKYKLQTGEYGIILRESYGIKSIKSVVVLPIKIDVKLDTRLNKYGNEIQGLAFPGQDPLLEKVLPFSNKTGFKSLDDYVRSIDEHIARLEKRIKVNPKLRDQLTERIDNLEKGKKEIFINHNLNTILEYGKSLAEKVKKAELGNLTLVETQDLLEEVTLLANISKSTHEYRQYMRGVDSTKLDEFDAKAGAITLELTEAVESLRDILFNNKITKLIEVHTGYKITDDFGNILPFAQEGYFGKWFYQLSQYDNPVFKTLRSILDEVNYKVRQQTDAVVEDIAKTENEVYNWLKQTGRSFEDLIEIMRNPATDNFWSRFSPEYIEMLKTLSGEELHKYYDPSEDYAERYQQRLLNTIQKFKDEGLTGKDLERNINNWIADNDLSIVEGKALYPGAWDKARFYNQLHMKDSPQNYNKEYKFIMSVPQLKAYYEMFEKYNKEFRHRLGVDYNNLPNNFLPNIRKTMSERVTEDGFSGFLDGTKDFFKDFSIREEDRSETDSYNSDTQIPIFFLNRFRTADGSLDVGEKSYQFGRSLAIFAKMAYNYEAVNERHAEILALQQFLSEAGEQVMQNRGKNLIDKMGNEVTEKLQATELPEIFKSFVDMYVYKIGVKSIIGDKSGAAERMLLKAKEYFTLKALGFNIVAGVGSMVTAKINAIIEGNKGIIFNNSNYKESMLSSWNDREKFLAINAYFDPMSHRHNNPRLAGETKYGERFYSDPTMRGWVNKYVNSRMLMNTFSIGDQYIEELVLVAMSKNYYVNELGNLKSIKNDAELELHKDRLVWNLFSYDKETGAKLNLTDDQMANAFESFRKAVQTGQSRIKGTIPDEDKAHWQNNIIMQLVMHFKSWMPGILFERFGKVKFDSRIDSIYMGKYTALGKEFQNPDRLVFSAFFKQIFLPKIGKLVLDISTFGLLSNNRLNDKMNKQLYFEKWLDQNPQHKGVVTFEEFNIVQQKQLKSVIQELRVLLIMAGLLVMLGMDWDGDDEKDYKKYLLTRKLASLMFKVQQEMSFVFDPTSFASMVKTPLPMIGLVTDARNTIANTIDEILDIPLGEDRLIGGTKGKDKQPIFYNSHKWFPGLGGVVRFFDLFNSDVAYSNTNQ